MGEEMTAIEIAVEKAEKLAKTELLDGLIEEAEQKKDTGITAERLKDLRKQLRASK